MAIYHCSIKIISRGKGKSAVAAAAYRAGEKIINQYDGRLNDYTRKSGIVHTEILLSDNAPSEYADRTVLWNAVETSERYKTAQLSREIEVALPKEMNEIQHRSLVREYVKLNFVDKGMCADICIHDKKDGNPHAHILLTMRPIKLDGSWEAKSKTVDGVKIPTVDWNEHTKAEEWRKNWAEITNKYLEKLNIDERIDHRSFKRQGLEQLPTIHLGSVAHQLEKKGIHTERGDINRQIVITNQRLRQLKARTKKLEVWTAKLEQAPNKPMLYDVVKNILENDGNKVYNLKSAAEMLIFLQENEIKDFAELDNKLKETIDIQFDVQSEFKPIERRLNTLAEHLKQSDNYFANKKYNDEFRALPPRKQKKYCEENRDKLQVFEVAKDYLKAVLNGRTTIPTKSWREEFEKLTAERSQLNQRYLKLKSDVDEVAKILKNVEQILKSQRQIKVPQMQKEQPEKSFDQMNIRERLAWGKIQADKQNAERARTQIKKPKYREMERG